MLARECGEPHGAIDDYASTPLVRAVRQHLAWHPSNPLLRYAPRPDVMADAAWRRGIAALKKFVGGRFSIGQMILE